MRSYWLMAGALCVGVIAGVVSTMAIGRSSPPPVDNSIDSVQPVFADLSIVRRSRVVNNGTAALPECSDVISLKLLIDLYDRRPAEYRAFETAKWDDGSKMAVVGLREVHTLSPDKVEQVKADDGTVIRLLCEGTIIANKNSGPYHFGYFPKIENGVVTTLYFAAKPVYGGSVSGIRGSAQAAFTF